MHGNPTFPHVKSGQINLLNTHLLCDFGTFEHDVIVCVHVISMCEKHGKFLWKIFYWVVNIFLFLCCKNITVIKLYLPIFSLIHLLAQRIIASSVVCYCTNLNITFKCLKCFYLTQKVIFRHFEESVESNLRVLGHVSLGSAAVSVLEE